MSKLSKDITEQVYNDYIKLINTGLLTKLREDSYDLHNWILLNIDEESKIEE